MSVEVHGLIANSFPLEYIEAVVADALKILPAYGHRRDTLVVVNAPPDRGHSRQTGAVGRWSRWTRSSKSLAVR